MSGVAMLLMIATSGITYGWIPDGGNGVRYIIQIPPDQLDQVQRVGEVSSRIAPEIQGHVSEIVVRIGDGPVPRTTPPHLSENRSGPADAAANQATAAARGPAIDQLAGDLVPMPIPSMNASSMPLPGGNVPGAAGRSTSLKPDPQSGGMNLPGYSMPSSMPSSMNYQNGATAGSGGGAMSAPASHSATSQGQSQSRDSGRQAADDPLLRIARPNSPSSEAGDNRNPSGRSSSNPYADAEGRYGGNQSRADVASGNYSDGRSNSVPTTNPVQGRMTSGTSDGDRQRSAGSSRTGIQDDRSWYDARGVAPRRPSTDPVSEPPGSDSRNGNGNGNMNGNNFAQLPTGLRDSQSASRVDYDPNLTAEQAARLPRNGYSFTRDGTPVDREGYPLDRYGNRTAGQNGNQNDRSTDRLGSDDPRSFPASATSRSTAQDRSDSYSRTSGNGYSGAPDGTAEDAAYPRVPSYADGYDFRRSSNAAVPQFSGNGSLNGNSSPGGNRGNPAYGQPQNYVGWGAPATSGAAGDPRSGVYAQAGDTRTVPYPYPQAGPTTPTPGANVGTSQPGGMRPGAADPRLASRSGAADGTGYNQPGMEVDVAAPSPSDRLASDRSGQDRSGRDLSTFSATSGSGVDDRPERVAAQPIFNGLLLCSVIVNVYLLFWLKNLRLQFRDMVASKRSAGGGGIAAIS